MKQIKSLIKPILLLLLLMVFGGVIGILNEQDVNFDLQNYHLYNAYAFLHGKIGTDFMAAGVHSCLNPLLDVYFYLIFFSFFEYPRIIAFLMGVPYGVLLWGVFYSAKKIFGSTKHACFLVILGVAISAGAAGIVSQIATTTNEILLACFNILAFYLILSFLPQMKKKIYIYIAAFIVGMGAGLKLTSAPFCVAAFAMVFVHFRHIKSPVKTLSIFIFCGGAGFFLTNGYFLWKNFELYQNPIFPYFNHIFASPYFDEIYLTENRFFPKTFFQWIFYPFYWAFSPGNFVTEGTLRDARIAACLPAVLLWFLQGLREKTEEINPRILISVSSYFAVAYILWLSNFSILRYAATLEALSGILLVGVAVFICRGRWRIYVALGMLGLLSMGQIIPDWGHEMFESKAVVFDRKPKVEDNALVFFMHLPSSYLAPLLNPKATYLGGFLYKAEEYPIEYQARAAKRNNLSPQYFGFHFDKEHRKRITNHTGPIYIISIDWPMLLNPTTLNRYGLQGKRENCSYFKTNWTVYSPKLAFCLVEKC